MRIDTNNVKELVELLNNKKPELKGSKVIFSQKNMALGVTVTNSVVIFFQIPAEIVAKIFCDPTNEHCRKLGLINDKHMCALQLVEVLANYNIALTDI